MARILAWCGARRSGLVVWSAIVVWSVALAGTARNAYDTFQLPRFDLGNMTQAVWSTAHGRPLEVTDPTTGEQVSRLAGHVDPLLALLSPLWLVWPSPLMLAAVQIVVCALGALPVLWLARRHLESESAAVLLALAYLLYPWLAWTALEAFHPVTLAIPLFLFALWFLETDRMWAFAVCAALILTTGELMGLTLALLGIWFWLARGERRRGLAIAGVGAAWSLVCIKLVVPAFRGDASPFYDRFESVGGSPEGLVRTLFTDPGAIAAALFTLDDVAYVIWLAIPLAGAFLLAPGLAAVGGIQLTVNLLSDSSPTTDPRTHYIAGIVPFLFAATIFGLARLPRPHRAPAATLVLVLCAALSLLVGQALAVSGIKRLGYQAELSAAHLDALDDGLALVPADAPVSSTNRVGAHLAARRYLYSAPVVGRAEWVVVDTSDALLSERGSTILEWDAAGLDAFVRRLRQDPAWTTRFERDGVLVLQRSGG